MSEVFDVIVVGAGPAGVQAAYYLKEHGLKFRVLERGNGVGFFFRHYPRHRRLISINKPYTGLSNAEQKMRYDWNSLLSEKGPVFTDYSKKYFPSADLMANYLEDFSAPFKDDIELDCEVKFISKPEGVFKIECANGKVFMTNQIIISSGFTLPWKPEIPGIDLCEIYNDFDKDPERFTDKRVLILGKGNSAMEIADSLIPTTQAIHVMSPNKVKFAWQSHYVGHLRALNTEFLDTYQLKCQNTMMDASPTKIEKEGDQFVVTIDMNAAEGHKMVLLYDHIICCTGWRWNSEILEESLRPNLKHGDKFPCMTSNWAHQSVPGIWFAGTIMQCIDFKKTMSGFVHGFRHNVESLVNFVNCKARNVSYPSEVISLEPEALTDYMINRFSVSCGLFLQPGFLCEVIRLDGPEAGKRLRDVPFGWAKENIVTEGEHITLTLEFGDFGENALHVKRSHEIQSEKGDPFIHPVARKWTNGEITAMVHLTDHVDADWRDDKDRDPGTVRFMTFKNPNGDEKVKLHPFNAARKQVEEFMSKCGLKKEM